MLKDPYFFQRGPVLVSLVFPAPRSGDGSRVFAAIRSDSYDGAEDAPKVNRLVGYGKTGEEAAASLIEIESEYFREDSEFLVTPDDKLSEIACRVVNKTVLAMDFFSDAREGWDREGEQGRVRVARAVAQEIQKVLHDVGIRLDRYEEMRFVFRE